MPNITFEWDASKASLNKKKHDISFDEANIVFLMKMPKLFMILNIQMMRKDLLSWG